MRKIQHLLIPYFSFLVLLSIPVYVMLISKLVENPGFTTLRQLLIFTIQKIWGGMYLQGWVGIFWFVICLFLTQQVYCIFSLHTRNDNRGIAILTVLRRIISFIGQYSIVLMFLHQPIQIVMLNNLGIESMISRFAVALLLPLLLPITHYKNIN